MKSASLRWAEEEFGHAALGDRRRNARVVGMAAACLERPGGTITRVMQDAAAREGSFRLVENPKVSAHRLARSSHRATVRRCQSLPYVFVAVDQSTVSVADYQAKKGFGPAGNGHSTMHRGVEVMSALAIAPNGTPLGLTAQRWRRRTDELAPRGKRDKRDIERRESYLWVEAMGSTLDRFQEAESTVRPWFQLDRGGDYWRVFDLAEQSDCWMTVRSSSSRRLWPNEASLHDRIRAAPVRGHLSTVIPARRNVRCPKRPKRNAVLALQFEPVTLDMFDNAKQYRQTDAYVVRVKEQTRTRDALEWILLTTYPTRCTEDAALVVQGYTQRWRVEDFHHAWKSGACDIERSQLRTARNFCKWATIQAAVAARIETLKHLSRSTPDAEATSQLSRAEVDAAIVLSGTKKHAPGDPLTLQQAVWLIAEVGGYTGKSSGGPPGTITIRRGLDRVNAAATAIERLRSD